MIVGSLFIGFAAPLGCAEPVDEDAATRWSRRHEATLDGMDTRIGRFLATLPSLPGDRFFCVETTVPPGLTEDQGKALTRELCEQQQYQWRIDRYTQEDELGTEILNGSFRAFGVVGVELTVTGPDGVEWSDHRGVWQFVSGTAAVDAAPTPRGWQLGYGTVEIGAETPANALEWRMVAKRREASATIRMFLLADGTPDAAFVQRSLAPVD
ncbi:MAG: hypothetical protein ABMB14_35865 [Myxococcota bacterium]